MLGTLNVNIKVFMWNVVGSARVIPAPIAASP